MTRLRLRLLALLAAAVPALTGCVIGLGSGPASPPEPGGTPATVPPGPGVLRTVPLQVLQNGPSTIAFVPVTIQGQGPFQFALDTGASNTVVDVQVADRLGLPRTGRRGQVSGVIGQQDVELVRADRWQIGDIVLAPGDLAVLDLPDVQQGPQFDGLIGSDVLSTFDYVVVDYDDRRLGLPPV